MTRALLGGLGPPGSPGETLLGQAHQTLWFSGLGPALGVGLGNSPGTSAPRSTVNDMSPSLHT